MPKVGELVRIRPEWSIDDHEQTLVFAVICANSNTNNVTIECINSTSLVEPERHTLAVYMIERL